MNQYDEHIRDSAPCSSRWDGYDRGDLEVSDRGTRVVGRMTATQGYKVEIVECWSDYDSIYQILVAGMVVQTAEDYPEAVIVARRWLS